MANKILEMVQGMPLLLLLVLPHQSLGGLICPKEKVLDSIHLRAHCIASSGMPGMQCNNAWDGDSSTIWHPATRGIHSYTSISYPTNVVINKVRILQHHWSLGWADEVEIFINNIKIKAKLQHRGYSLNWDEIALSHSYHTALMTVIISSVKNHAFGGIREIQVFGCLPEEALGRLTDWQNLGHVIKPHVGAIAPNAPPISQTIMEDNIVVTTEPSEIIDEIIQDTTTQEIIIKEETTTDMSSNEESTVKEVEPEDTFYDPDDIFGFQDDLSNFDKVYDIGFDDSQSLHDYRDIKSERMALSSLSTTMAGVLAVVILVFLAGLAGYWYRAGHRYNMSLTGPSCDRERYLVQDDDVSYFTERSSAASLREETKC